MGSDGVGSVLFAVRRTSAVSPTLRAHPLQDGENGLVHADDINRELHPSLPTSCRWSPDITFFA